MTAEEFIIFISLVLGTGYGIIYHTVRSRLIGKRKTIPIGQLKSGYAEVQGRAIAMEESNESHSEVRLLESPYSKKSCLYYHFKVETLSSRGHRTYIDDTRHKPFGIEDNSGWARLHWNDAEMTMKSDIHETCDYFQKIPESLQNLFQHYGVERMNRSPGLRITETVLKENDPLYVVGPVIVDRDKISFQRNHNGALVNWRTPFIISNRSKTEIMSQYNSAPFWIILIIIVCVVVYLKLLFMGIL